MSRVNHRVSFTIIALSTAASALPAYAEEPVRQVRYADLNLATEAGAATLERRINSAAASMCGPYESRRVDQAASWKRCHDATVATATKRVNEAIALARRNNQEQHAGAVVSGTTVATR